MTTTVKLITLTLMLASFGIGWLCGFLAARSAFEALWDSTYGKTYPWILNPWVWVIEFKRIACS